MGVKGNAFYEETVPFYICGKELRRPLCLLEGHRGGALCFVFVLCPCGAEGPAPAVGPTGPPPGVQFGVAGVKCLDQVSGLGVRGSAADREQPSRGQRES